MVDSVAWMDVSSFFSLDDLQMPLFLYKLGIKLPKVSDVHGIDIQLNIMCVFYIVYMKTIKIFVNLGFSDVLTFLFL